MTKLRLSALLWLLAAAPAWAEGGYWVNPWIILAQNDVNPSWTQNPTCPTRPVGDDSNACASTAFVQQNAGGGGGGNVNVIQWDSINVGTPTTWGTAPTGQTVIGVNADVLNTVTVTGTVTITPSGLQNVNVTEWNTVAVGNPTTWDTVPTGQVVIGANVDLAAVHVGVVVPVTTTSGSIVNTVTTNNIDTAPHLCGSYVFKHITTATDTQILAASGSTTIYVCDYNLSFGGTGNAFLEKSTTGTCGSPTQIDITWYGANQVGKAGSNPYYRGLNTGASAQLCVNTSQAVSFDIGVFYDQY